MAPSTRPATPTSLQAGDAVSLIASAFPFDKKAFNAGRLYCEQNLKLKPVYRKDVFTVEGLFSGSTARRTKELTDALLSRRTKAVFSIRGGYGTALTIETLRANLKKAKGRLEPKILLGYSDLTLALNMLYQDFGWVTFHGPMVAGRAFHSPKPSEHKTFIRTLFSGSPLGPISTPKMKTLIPGQTRGPLIGGCLSLLVSALGTSYEVNTAGHILFLEDIGEAPYKLHRMLTQLRHAGAFNKVKGIVFGEMASCLPHAKAFKHVNAKAAITHALQGLKIPVILDFPAGHGSTQFTIPLGQNVELLASPRSRPIVNFKERPTGV